MGACRKDVDLEFVLKNPSSARKWIKDFDWEMLQAPEYVVAGVDEKIYLQNMDDEQAVRVAHLLLNDVEIPRSIRELAYERYTH
jgi:predicted nucleic acid-binding protein